MSNNKITNEVKSWYEQTEAEKANEVVVKVEKVKKAKGEKVKGEHKFINRDKEVVDVATILAKEVIDNGEPIPNFDVSSYISTKITCKGSVIAGKTVKVRHIEFIYAGGSKCSFNEIYTFDGTLTTATVSKMKWSDVNPGKTKDYLNRLVSKVDKTTNETKPRLDKPIPPVVINNEVSQVNVVNTHNETVIDNDKWEIVSALPLTSKNIPMKPCSDGVKCKHYIAYDTKGIPMPPKHTTWFHEVSPTEFRRVKVVKATSIVEKQ